MRTILDILNFHKEELNVIRKSDYYPGKEYYAVDYFGELKKPEFGFIGGFHIREFQANGSIYVKLSSKSVWRFKHFRALNSIVAHLGSDSNGMGKGSFLGDSLRYYEYDTANQLLYKDSDDYSYMVSLIYSHDRKSTLEILGYDFLIKKCGIKKNW